MFVTVLIGIVLSLIALTTTIGNLIVLLAFYGDPKLRTINDYFILNMAIADFLVGFFCIPFYIPFSLTRSWPFGSFFCQIWVTIDDVSTMASVINIVAITINRYWSIAYPISYRRYARQHLVYLIMASVWILSFLNFAPGIWLFRWSEKKTNVDVKECLGDYNNSFLYMFIAQLNYFIWPFVVLCLLNLLILINICQRTRKLTHLRSNQSISIVCRSINDPRHLLSPQSQSRFDQLEKEKSSPSTKTHFTSLSDPLANRTTRVVLCPSLERSKEIRQCPTIVTNKCRTDFRIGRDRRAARSLFILVFIFLIFLFPYVLCALASTAGFRLSPLLLEISFWLLWLNSTCNPFLYPFIQIKYRRAYLKLFQSTRRFFSLRCCSSANND